MADIRPGDRSICPRCGNGGPAIMNFEGTLPMLDIGGYPQYFCRTCGRPFTALTRPDELIQEKEDYKRRLELKDLLPPTE